MSVLAVRFVPVVSTVFSLAVAGAALAQGGPNGAAGSEPPAPLPVATSPTADPQDGDGEPTGSEAGEEQDDEVDIEELERRVEILAEELERLRSGEVEREVTIDEARALGLAPSAAATYGQDTGVSIAGYGEMLYENYASSKTDQFDFLRAILYAGYRFNDRFLFNSEIEVEHAKEIFVEFAYVDFLATENIGLRAGMLLIPMGLEPLAKS